MNVLAIITAAAMGRSMPSLFTDAGVFAKVILLLLLFISVISWAIIWDRARLYLRLRAKGQKLRQLLFSQNLASVIKTADNYVPSVEASLVTEAHRYISVAGGDPSAPQLVVPGVDEETSHRAKLRELLERRATNEISEMERHLVFLSTTASIAPFLGLLGTVWGIMTSFLSMGAHGAASIEVVGPGIAEALVTTIAGLAAAIPALVGYNLLVRHVHRQETRVDLLISRIVDDGVTTDARVHERAHKAEHSGAGV